MYLSRRRRRASSASETEGRDDDFGLDLTLEGLRMVVGVGWRLEAVETSDDLDGGRGLAESTFERSSCETTLSCLGSTCSETFGFFREGLSSS